MTMMISRLRCCSILKYDNLLHRTLSTDTVTQKVTCSPDVAKDSDTLPSILGFTKLELGTYLQDVMDLPRYRVDQIWNFIYREKMGNFNDSSNIPKVLRSRLAEHFSSLDGTASALNHQISEDGTQKWLLELGVNQSVESVFIPDDARGTACLSSQVGCSLACSFCATGAMGKPLGGRNLSAGQIVAQFLHMRHDLLSRGYISHDGSKIKKNTKANPGLLGMMAPKPVSSELKPPRLSNIVMMGMGEPLYNYRNVKKALQIIMDKDGLALSRRHITISTSGVIPNIEKLATELGVRLAVSLHAATDDLRSELVPLNRTYPLKDLIESCKRYSEIGPMRRITFEYVMLAGVNDSLADARELAKLLKGMTAFVNFIPFNPWPGSKYTSSSNEKITLFAQKVQERNRNLQCQIRWPRGSDIDGACGQLKGKK